MLKNYGEIRVTQRTATGQDDSGKTNLYVVSNVQSNNGDVALMGIMDAKEMVKFNQSTILGVVTIIHPVILAGSWEENFSDFCRLALKKLEQDGVIVRSECGTCFLAS